MSDQGTAGFKGKIQVNKGSTTWNEVGHVTNAPPQLSKGELDTTQYGNEGMARIQGLADGTIDVECNLDATDAGQKDLRDAWSDGDMIDVEISPNDRDADATTLVIGFKAKVFNVNFAGAVADKNTVTYQLMAADGEAPTFSASFSS